LADGACCAGCLRPASDAAARHREGLKGPTDRGSTLPSRARRRRQRRTADVAFGGHWRGPVEVRRMPDAARERLNGRFRTLGGMSIGLASAARLQQGKPGHGDRPALVGSSSESRGAMPGDVDLERGERVRPSSRLGGGGTLSLGSTSEGVRR